MARPVKFALVAFETPIYKLGVGDILTVAYTGVTDRKDVHVLDSAGD